MVAADDCGAQPRCDLSAAFFLGASARTGAARQDVEGRAVAPHADIAERACGDDHGGCVAGALSSSVAQGHLAAGAARRMKSDLPPKTRSFAGSRIAPS